MIFNGVNVPDVVIEAIHNKKLVVFAGAGVSIDSPSCLPNFEKLALEIAHNTGEKRNPDEESIERFLGRLTDSGIPVKEIASHILGAESSLPNVLHKEILNLFRSNEDIRIVTTNYDLLFEKVVASKNTVMQQYSYPALPHGDQFNGIVHIHGDIKNPENMIISDMDFGKAYMLIPDVPIFLSQLFNSDYLVLFVGYSFLTL